MTDKEALELALMTLEHDNLKVGNIYVNYDIQKALIKLVKKKLGKKNKKKEWVGLTTDEVFELASTKLPHGLFAGLIEAKLKEKNG
jgi:hypothetical protein